MTSHDHRIEGAGQDPFDFTVQIRHWRTDAIVGAGFLVPEHKVITCAHVVEDAGLDPKSGNRSNRSARHTFLSRRTSNPQLDVPAMLGVRLLRQSSGLAWAGQARLLHHLDQESDDVVVLLIVGELPALRPTQLAVLGECHPNERHSFLSVGFPKHQGGLGFRVTGKIMGTVTGSDVKPMLCEPVQLKTDQIAKRGMSGSAVLDEEQNLVVGVIKESFLEPKGFHGKGVAWAVNARVLQLPPFTLMLQKSPLARRPEPPPRIDEAEVQAAAIPEPGDIFSHYVRFSDSIPRTELLSLLLSAADEPRCHVIGLIGFGGEGKTTMADDLASKLSSRWSTSIFWWTFKKPDVEEFFEAAVAHLTKGRILTQGLTSTTQRMDVLSAIIKAHRYIFVLDGLEAVQDSTVRGRGGIANEDLRIFLRRFALMEHPSLCIVTSRLPILDLFNVPSSTYHEYHVERLTAEEGRELFRRRHVTSPVVAVDALVETWSGHALTLSLIAGLITDRLGGDASRALNLPAPIASQTSDERLAAMLSYYDRHLSDAERAVLTILSAYRTPINISHFIELVQHQGLVQLNACLPVSNEGQLRKILGQLDVLSVLRVSIDGELCDLHPLVSMHHLEVLRHLDTVVRFKLHELIAQWYVQQGAEISESSELGDLTPLIEAVYHFCCANRHEVALDLYRERLECGDSMRLSYKLNAYDTVSSLMDAFFSDSNYSKDPPMQSGVDARYILNRKAVASMNSGQLKQGADLFERASAVGERSGDQLGASQSAQNLAEVNIYLGNIARSADAARRALTLAERLTGRQRDEELRDCHCYLGLAAALAGHDAEATRAFEHAEYLQTVLTPDSPILTDIWGIAHADFLRRSGDHDRATVIAEANLRFALDRNLRDDVSICYRLLGDLEIAAGNERTAMKYFNNSVNAARRIYERTVLIEALLARGRAHARWADTARAADDLQEALGYAESGGYALYEVDAHIGLAWRHWRLDDRERTGAEVLWCRQRAAELGYVWGLRDVAEIQEQLDADA